MASAPTVAQVTRLARLFALCATAACLLLLFTYSRVRPGYGATIPSYSGNIQDDEKEMCSRHGWRALEEAYPGTKRKIYDMVMINTELDWLEIRLGTTYAEVDFTVVVEANTTFTGLSKPLHLRDQWARFEPYHEKMIYHQVEFPTGFQPQDAWETEAFVRNSMLDQVLQRLTGSKMPNLGDALIVADVDEIPRPESLRILRICEFPRFVTLYSRFYYYSFQFLHRGMDWHHPQATFFEGRDTISPNNLRGGVTNNDLDKGEMRNASWHCSWCFNTTAEFQTKLKSFSHTEYNKEEYRNRTWIADHVRSGLDLWDRGDIYDRIEGNMDLPDYLVRYPDRYPYLISRDGETAGLADYP